MSLDTRKKQIKVEHFMNLIAVAFADGKIEPEEEEFFMERGEEFGMTDDEIREIINNAHQLQFQVPMNQTDREEQLSDAVYMAMVDGEIDDKEYELCLTIAEKLELGKKDVDQVVSLVKKLWANEK